MGEETTIVPSQIVELRSTPINEIDKTAEEAVEATRSLNKACEALEDLSISLADLIKAKDNYDRMVPHVKKQMRNLVTRL